MNILKIDTKLQSLLLKCKNMFLHTGFKSKEVKKLNSTEKNTKKI